MKSLFTCDHFFIIIFQFELFKGVLRIFGMMNPCLCVQIAWTVVYQLIIYIEDSAPELATGFCNLRYFHFLFFCSFAFFQIFCQMPPSYFSIFLLLFS